ncbi:MAG: hypothetical protein COU31_00590 [Candidatus Magasanikbacteria bacterium CG10_big_fil_rev_8_21_14_0_10_40_10]|uniref:GtrA/DPMS transmembrane domain-containing protein n=1 Tax=Candidatus Magasanikbacteria bacterium CG10_big_fil_rev_8_21_14_0_10_40_10 TaxID=1974648 RepID=A0A2M6W4U4_9BACT|nr:MAG: hypothetical protein COU31_00590 [Candidatus Magasanikbacteria bacterium CG10_big_fil_rev_8_21_14_0_10_40_10]
MFKKLILHLWSLRRQFIKYAVIGSSALVLDIGSLFLFINFFHLSPVYGVVINQLIVLNYVFLLNRFWTFRSTHMISGQIIKFASLAGFNYIVSIIWMWFFNGHYGFNYLLVRIANIFLSACWNFFLYKYWIYKKPRLEA